VKTIIEKSGVKVKVLVKLHRFQVVIVQMIKETVERLTRKIKTKVLEKKKMIYYLNYIRQLKNQVEDGLLE
jgi:predicted nucleic acid-binding protein